MGDGAIVFGGGAVFDKKNKVCRWAPLPSSPHTPLPTSHTSVRIPTRAYTHVRVCVRAQQGLLYGGGFSRKRRRRRRKVYSKLTKEGKGMCGVACIGKLHLH